ncbi:MAG TPA: phosphoribosylformylglycinamidine synthase [Deltaproteobacteria bacterium]|nr:phosphoribosylformylglycinamidine synthase [Deltaproteobacteria bacterium]
MKAKVTVKLKSGVLDPQGKAIVHSAHTLGFTAIQEVRVGKVFEIDIETADSQQAKAQLEQLAGQLLANTVIENFSVEIL